MNVLLVCLGNICRSPMAEGVLRHRARERGIAIITDSAGTGGYHIGEAPDRRAQAAMRKQGMDIGDLRARQFEPEDYDRFDLLLAMEIRHVHRLTANGIPPEAIALLGAWASPRRLHLHDPALTTDEYFMTCFALIHSAVINLVGDLRAAGSPCVLP